MTYLAAFRDCMAGPQVPAPCCWDKDGDGDTDLLDFSLMQMGTTG